MNYNAPVFKEIHYKPVANIHLRMLLVKVPRHKPAQTHIHPLLVLFGLHSVEHPSKFSPEHYTPPSLLYLLTSLCVIQRVLKLKSALTVSESLHTKLRFPEVQLPFEDRPLSQRQTPGERDLP